MIGRALVLLIAVLLAVHLINRWRAPRVPPRPPAPPIQSARKCPDCDAYVLGAHPDPCDRPDCRFRRA